jgi:CheY-like chemotaxis protein
MPLHGFPLSGVVQTLPCGGQGLSRGGLPVGAHVLVVEDEADLRSALVELLSIWGYRVSSACDGREALERLRAGQEPVVVLLDLQMPVMNGDELLDEVTRDPPQRPLRIIVLSANVDVERREAHDRVAAALNKPVTADRLHATVDAEAHALE